MTPLIYFRCQSPEHQLPIKPDRGQPGSPITFHDRRWAYCPLGASEGHAWTELTQGLSVSELTIWVREVPTA
jgi:hypothetical protein